MLDDALTKVEIDAFRREYGNLSLMPAEANTAEFGPSDPDGSLMVEATRPSV
jgi:hypothetical protein